MAPLMCLTAAAILAVATSSSAANPVERHAPADARGEVEIVNVSGEVEVHGWDRAEVQVTAALGDGGERLDFQSLAKRTLIQVVLPRGRSSSGSTVIVRVPRASTLSINTVSADQSIAEVRGAQRLQAVSGVISTQVWSDDVSIKTISGDVIVSGHRTIAVTAVNTVSGDIKLTALAGELQLETVTGDIDARMDSLTRGRIRTINGEVQLRAKLAGDARLDAEAVNGDLRFIFAAPIDAAFDIETFNGEIDNCFGPKSIRSSEFAPGNELRFSQGQGGARVRVKTLNGGVEICKE